MPAVLMEAAAKGAPEEEDLFLARALLQTLAVGPGGRGPEAAAARRDRVTGAAELLDAYQSLACRSLPDTPLVHFLRLLLKVRSGSPALHIRVEGMPAVRTLDSKPKNSPAAGQNMVRRSLHIWDSCVAELYAES